MFGAGELRDLHKLTTTFLQSDHGDKGYTERIANLDRDKAHALAEAYLQRLRELAPRADRVIDKMPFNYLDLGIIATLFPRGRIIHCRRGPVDTCVSSFFQNFGDPLAFTLDLRHLGHYYREYERLMAHWARVLPVPIFELRYEDLTADQEAVSRRLVAFCGLDWDELPAFQRHRAQWCARRAYCKCASRCIAAPWAAGNGMKRTCNRCMKRCGGSPNSLFFSLPPFATDWRRRPGCS